MGPSPPPFILLETRMRDLTAPSLTCLRAWTAGLGVSRVQGDACARRGRACASGLKHLVAHAAALKDARRVEEESRPRARGETIRTGRSTWIFSTTPKWPIQARGCEEDKQNGVSLAFHAPALRRAKMKHQWMLLIAPRSGSLPIHPSPRNEFVRLKTLQGISEIDCQRK